MEANKKRNDRIILAFAIIAGGLVGLGVSLHMILN